MDTVTALIIDDEVHNRNVLQTLLLKYCPIIKIIDQADNADDAFEKINTLKPQLVFLDIKMPKKSGFDLLKQFTKINFEVIFVSAFNEFAITAFDFNAIGYILKPIDYSKLINVVDKAVIKINTNNQDDTVFHFIKTLKEEEDLINKVSIHHNGKVLFIHIDDILSIETIIDTAEIKTINNQIYYSSKGIKDFENLLKDHVSFIRISRSTLLNSNFIVSYSKGETCIVELQNGQNFEISRRKKSEVLEKIKSL